MAEKHSSPYGKHLGIEAIEVSPEKSVAAVTIEPHHLNAHGIVHGGLIFSLADTAFGLAENAGDEKFIAMETHVRFLRPGLIGQRLTATATRLHRGRQTAFYRMDVHDERGRLIAAFSGSGHILNEPDPE
ncbi:MAG: PaaI family thioesterase [Candidatus Sumerlaeia bacterium]